MKFDRLHAALCAALVCRQMKILLCSLFVVAGVASLSTSVSAQGTLAPLPNCGPGNFGNLIVHHTAAWNGTVVVPPLSGDLGENCFEASNGNTTWTYCWALTNPFQLSDGGSIATQGTAFASFSRLGGGGTVNFSSQLCVAAVATAIANPGSSASSNTASSATLNSSVLASPQSLGIALSAFADVPLCGSPQFDHKNGGQLQPFAVFALNQTLFTVNHFTQSSSSAAAARDLFELPDCPSGNAYANAGSSGRIDTTAFLN